MNLTLDLFINFIQVSRLGFGCAGLSGIYNEPFPEEASFAVIKQVFAKGITFFDTSDLYGDDHHNEFMLAKVDFLFSPSFTYLFMQKKVQLALPMIRP